MGPRFYCTCIVVLSWPEDGRSRPKHVAKYNLIVIIASCLDLCCVLTVRNILHKFNNTPRDDLSLSQKGHNIKIELNVLLNEILLEC